MSKRKIAVFGPSLSALSGVSTHVRILLASNLKRDHELLHFQVGSEGRAENRLQQLIRFAVSPFQLALFLLRTNAEVVHLNASLDAKGYWRDLTYALVARALGRRVMNQIHGGALPQNFFRGNVLLTWILRQFLLASDVVTVLSSAEVNAYRSFDARINVHLVPNAIDPNGLCDQVRSYNRHERLKLVYVGRLVRAKGLFEMVEALVALRRAGRDFKLCLAGEGRDKQELEAAVARAGLQDRVVFLGGVFGAQKHRLLLDSDVLVFPSYTEGLPYSLLEAMAAGCVPITTPVAAIPDVIEAAVHGLLVPVRDARSLALAIAALDDDRERLVQMAESARRRILEKYTVARLADDCRRLYRTARCKPRARLLPGCIGVMAILLVTGWLPFVAKSETREFFCTFASSPTDCGFYEQAKQQGHRASIVGIGRDGPTAVRLHTEPGDDDVAGSRAAERNDLKLSQSKTDCYEGREQWWAHSILFPDDYVDPPMSTGTDWNWGAVAGFHNSAPGAWLGNFTVTAMPAKAISPDRHTGLWFQGYGGIRSGDGAFAAPIGPVIRNVWYDFVYHVKWSSGKDGFFDAWVNGHKKLAHRGPTLYAGQGCYLKLENYHSAFGRPSSVIHDRVIRGVTASAVSARPLEQVLR